MSGITLKQRRMIHNAIVFTISLFISFYSHIPFAFWVSATVLAIMLPMDSSQIQERIYGVFWGTVHGLILFIPIWLILDINGNLIFFIIPLSLAAANFFQIHNFTRNIAFLNINLGLFLEYMQYGNYHYSSYFVARLMTIIIGIFLAYFGDFFFINRKNYAQEEFITTLKNLNQTIKEALNKFIKFNQLDINNKLDLELITHINKVNNLITILNTSYKSIKLEQKTASLINYTTIPPLLSKYKLELFTLSYAIQFKTGIAEHRINNILINFKQISHQLLNETQIILDMSLK